MKYKTIKSAAHNFAHSFTSGLNYVGCDYVMSHLAHAAAASGEPELRADLLQDAAWPAALLVLPVRESLEYYRLWFPGLLDRQRIPRDVVRRAVMRVRLHLEHRTDSAVHPGTWIVPFAAVVEIEDDRGAMHVGGVRDRWYVESWRDAQSTGL